MSTTKSTKKSLILSVLSIVLCFTMLLGTTYAWFTDSVTTGKNKIVAGSLDVELYTKVGDDYVAVDENTSLFDENALWEPGYTQTVYLKVKNAGTLALKYKLAVDAVSEISGTNVFDESFLLSDHLVFGQAEGSTETIYDTREAAWAAVGDTKGLGSYTKNGALAAAAEEYIALVVYMPTTVGNEANYKTGTTPPSVELGVTLVATQNTVEADSYGNDYDAGAEYPVTDPTLLKSTLDAAEEGTTVKLAAGEFELTPDAYSILKEGSSLIGATDENGNPATVINTTQRIYASEDNITISNIIFKSDTITGYMPLLRTQEERLGHYSHNFTISNCTFIMKEDQGGLMFFGGTVRDCTFIGGHFGIGSSYAHADALIENCSIDGGTFGIHFDGGTDTKTVTVRGCTINGVCAIASGIKEVIFENCSFSKTAKDAYVDPYGDRVTYIDCTFADDFKLRANDANAIIILTGCKAASSAAITSAVIDTDYAASLNATWIIDSITVDFGN